MVVEQFKRALKGHPLKQQQRMAADLARRNALTFVEYEDLMRFIEADQIMQKYRTHGARKRSRSQSD